MAPGTNRAALEADIDILAHPGLITKEDAALARERGIFLEITARKGHCLANGHVARTALEVGASLIVNTDAHGPGDLITSQQARLIARGAGLTDTAFQNLAADVEALAQSRRSYIDHLGSRSLAWFGGSAGRRRGLRRRRLCRGRRGCW